MSAAGHYVPTFVIFPSKNMSYVLMKNSPQASVKKVHPSGWIQSSLFTESFTHFIEVVKLTEDAPVLIILDGHYSHVWNVEIIDTARINHATIISLPAHSMNKLQPLDKTFLGLLKVHYSEKIQATGIYAIQTNMLQKMMWWNCLENPSWEFEQDKSLKAVSVWLEFIL